MWGPRAYYNMDGSGYNFERSLILNVGIRTLELFGMCPVPYRNRDSWLSVYNKADRYAKSAFTCNRFPVILQSRVPRARFDFIAKALNVAWRAIRKYGCELHHLQAVVRSWRLSSSVLISSKSEMILRGSRWCYLGFLNRPDQAKKVRPRAIRTLRTRCAHRIGRAGTGTWWKGWK
jgi:hypothetical protein